MMANDDRERNRRKKKRNYHYFGIIVRPLACHLKVINGMIFHCWE